KIFHAEIVVDNERVKRETSKYQQIPVITNFVDEDGVDRMKDMIKENYDRIKAEIRQTVEDELERIKNDPILCHLLPDQE
ncbi:conjugal transfer protein TraG, partial [Dysgonomonas sp. OttesenSCG-928-D17]|nr:conjugal transfer protein TraG [Dysgonomonas sp. OttesenSCG-928-D17]